MERSLEMVKFTLDGIRRMAEAMLILMTPILIPLIALFLLLSPFILLLEIIWLFHLLSR